VVWAFSAAKEVEEGGEKRYQGRGGKKQMTWVGEGTKRFG